MKKSIIQFLKFLFVGFVLSISLIFVVPSIAETFVDTAYIRPRTLVFAKGNFWVYAHNNFDQSEQTMIRSSASKLHEQLNNATQRSKLIDCALVRTVRSKPNKQTVDNQLKQVFVNAASGNRPIKTTVAYMWSGTDPRHQNAVGWAPIGNAGQFPEKGDLLRVAFNRDYLGDGSSYTLRSDVDYWAATLVHEIFHNLGYDHPQNRGDFITEFDLCVNFNGNIPQRLGLNGPEDDIDSIYFLMKK
jgi:hypothetical protein